MRTKTLLIAAAALAVGIIAPKAQTVYSANVVGYVTLSLTNGENLIGNQLDLDGTGTNNTLQSVFSTNLPNATKIWTFANGGWTSVSWSTSSGGKWLGASTNLANAALNPGYGVFVDLPSPPTLPATNITITLVGQVLQGAYTNPIAAGIRIVSSQIPLSGYVDTNLFYVPTKGDKVYTWNPATQNYGATSPSYNGTKWLGGSPNLSVAQPIILSAASNTVWGVNFIVQ